MKDPEDTAFVVGGGIAIPLAIGASFSIIIWMFVRYLPSMATSISESTILGIFAHIFISYWPLAMVVVFSIVVTVVWAAIAGTVVWLLILLERGLRWIERVSDSMWGIFSETDETE